MKQRPSNNLGHLLAALGAGAILVLIAILQSLSPGLLIQVYGVDTLFVLDVIERTARGEIPHSDFTLHLGALPFAAISLLSDDTVEGFIRGQWALAASLIVTGGILARRRLGPWPTVFLLISIVLLSTALSTLFDPRITLALFYNRWAWAIALIFLVATLIRPPENKRFWLDNVLIGILAMALLTTKVTFFAILVPIAALAYAFDRRWRDIAATCLTCLAIAASVAAFWGVGFWLDYLENLIWVAENPIRKTAGQSFWDTATSTSYIAHYVAYGFFLYLIARTGKMSTTVVFLLLGPGLLFLQNQNFGQVPIWTCALAPIALACRPTATKSNLTGNAAFQVVAAAFLLVSLLPLYTAAQSTWRNAAPLPEGAVQMVPGADRLARIYATAPQAGPVTERRIPLGDNPPKHLGTCHATSGFLRVFKGVADELSDLKLPVFVVDAQSMYWMQNGMTPLPGAAPWNYGSLRGLQNASYVAIPRCPFKPSYQRAILRHMENVGIRLTLVRKGEWVTVMRWEASQND